MAFVSRRVIIVVVGALVVAALLFWGVTEILVHTLFRSETPARVAPPSATETAKILREVRVRDLADRVRAEVGEKAPAAALLEQSLERAKKEAGGPPQGTAASVTREGGGFAVCLTDRPVLCALIEPGTRMARVGSADDPAAAISAARDATP